MNYSNFKIFRWGNIFKGLIEVPWVWKETEESRNKRWREKGRKETRVGHIYQKRGTILKMLPKHIHAARTAYTLPLHPNWETQRELCSWTLSPHSTFPFSFLNISRSCLKCPGTSNGLSFQSVWHVITEITFDIISNRIFNNEINTD